MTIVPEILLLFGFGVFLFQFLLMLLDGQMYLPIAHLLLASAFIIAAAFTAKTSLYALVVASPVLYISGIVCLSVGVLALIRFIIY